MLGLRRTPARLRGTVKAALGPSLTRSIRPLLPALSPLATYDLQQVPNSFEKCAGPLGVAVSLAISSSTLALIYLGLTVGLDPHSISERLPWTDLPPGLSKMGTFGIALLLNKMLIPVKIPLYVGATAWLGRRFPHLKQLGQTKPKQE